MLSWQKMASFTDYRGELHDLSYTRGTRKRRSLCDRAHLRRLWRRLVKESARQLVPAWRYSGFTEEEKEEEEEYDNDDTNS